MNILAPFLPYILAVGAAIVALLGYGAWQYRKGVKEAETDAMMDAYDREKGGRDAVVQEQADADGLSNGDIVDRMRRRDSDFTGL